MQARVFGDHELGIPYRPIAELLAKYCARDPNKTAIVDLDSESSITFGELDQAVTDIAVDLKLCGVKKGDRVLLLSDECLEKLLIWLGVWRIGAVICPLNIEINEKMMVELTHSVNPKLIFCHKDLDMAALVGDHPARKVCFGRWGKEADAKDEFFTKLKSGHRPEEAPERNNPEDVACIFCTSERRRKK